jgi:hypothetical protein
LPHESTFFQEVRPLATELDRVTPEKTTPILERLFTEGWKRHGRQDQPWVVHKNPQDSLIISAVVRWCPPACVILLARNPYAICHSLLEQGYPPSWACSHMRDYYTPLLELENRCPQLFYRARYEELAKEPERTLPELLKGVFDLPMCTRCRTWEKTPVRWGQGDPKVSETQSWEGCRADIWRAGLSPEARDYVRVECNELFEAFKYNPEDVGLLPQ